MTKLFADAIFEAEKHSKKEPKTAALAGLQGEQLRLATEALDTFRPFFVTLKTIVKPTTYAKVDGPLAPFFDLLDKLAARTLSGHEARDAVTAVLAGYTELTAAALIRVLNKDLKCGATANTFKRIYPSIDLTDWDLMGAEKMITPKEAVNKGLKAYVWGFPCIGESKYDGNRSVITVELATRKVNYFSRNGLVQEAYLGLFDAEALRFAEHMGKDVIIDGEILSTAGFQATQKAKGSGNDKSALLFWAFDWMSLAEWKARSCSMQQLGRSATLADALADLKMPRMIKSKSRILNNMEEAFAFYNEVLEEGKNADGTLNGLGEGLIIKRGDSFYEWTMSGTRSDAWTKWKPVYDFDLKVVGLELGDPGTKNADKLGALNMVGFDENGNKIVTNCGGLKVNDKRMIPWLTELMIKNHIDFFDTKALNYIKNRDHWLRAHLIAHPEEVLNKTFMVEAQEMTKAENAENFSLRFPQLVMPRPDKD
jgi:ATP-dependent DNA ligase